MRLEYQADEQLGIPGAKRRWYSLFSLCGDNNRRRKGLLLTKDSKMGLGRNKDWVHGSKELP